MPMPRGVELVAAALLLPAACVAGGLAPARYFDQRLDHFDGSSTQNWSQAYYVNDTYYDGKGPVFLCVGGEGPAFDGSVVQSSVHCNNAVEWLQEKGAIMFAVQHRYYGCNGGPPMQDCPVKAWSSDVNADLRYLSSHQVSPRDPCLSTPLPDIHTLHVHY